MALQTERLRNQQASGSASGSGTNAVWDRLKERPQRWRGFLHDVRVELRQVTWPTRREVAVTTFVVIVAVAFFGLFFFSVDSTLGYVVQRVFSFFKAT